MLTAADVEQRIKILRRFRSMLLQQREKFRNYLHVLDIQERAVQDGDTDKVIAHAEIEQGMVAEIMALQKVIDPLQEMYDHNFPGGDREITELQDSLIRLREQILQRNEATRAFLVRKKEELKHRIDNLRLPNTARRAYTVQQPTLLDIRA